MNFVLIKYFIHKIFKQPLTKVIVFINLTILMLFFLTKFSFDKVEIIELNVLGLNLDEPYLIKQIIQSVFSLIIVILLSLLIIIINRFYHELKSDSLLVLILTKLRNKSAVVYSSLFGVFILFFILFFIEVFFLLIFFRLLYDVSYFIYFLNFSLNISLAIIYIAVISFFLNQFLDGFSVSILMLLIFYFENMIFSLISNNDLLFVILNILFPLNQLNRNLHLLFVGEISFQQSLISIPLLLLFFIHFGKVFFLKKWE